MVMDLFKLGGFKRRANRGGASITNTFNGQTPGGLLSVPMYQEHMRDLFKDRFRKDSRSIMKEAFQGDPDVSAAVNAYLTVSNTDMLVSVHDEQGNLDREGYAVLQQIIRRLTVQSDFSAFQLKPSLRLLAAEMRYMILLRGGVANELVFDRTLAPSEIRQVDLATVRWKEPKPGQYKPVQIPAGGVGEIPLDIPTFFVSFFRRDPTSIYTNSHFVSAINTIAARQQVINDLYRIMYVTGFPRIDIKVLEDVVRQSAPADVQADADKMANWARSKLQEIAKSFGSLRVDQAFIHWDSVEASIINDDNPGVGIDISKVIDVLNAQNQAALKVMSTIIGRGESGVNTASVEARIFSMNADEINEPVADNLSRLFTFALMMQGRANYAVVRFRKAELRPSLELENHMTMRQSRLLSLLSLGLINDDEFHMEMFGRHRPDDAPALAGTGFMTVSSTTTDTSAEESGNALDRSLTPEGSAVANSKMVKKS
ncbi:hypothetical protein D3877_23450 [Azospirillum cavernae]|uniref:DUF1073 domain-containing protein n=1 Tax=Azospirillum cavernae TaxID=2320860 RepID=A0A418VPG0_9PROT|nr:hypothetical protein [Azospirillum cavernae]RJF78089.1 hypothetical protein D3877_23450 [Azospirillum cavernae]